MLFRHALLAVVAVTSCTRAGEETKQTQAPATPRSEEEPAKPRAELRQRDAELTRWEGLGMPLIGDIRYSIALEAPAGDLSRASGKITFECDECSLGSGDERIYLHRPGGETRRRTTFGDGGLDLPPIALGTVEAAVRFRDGEGTLKASADAGELYRLKLTGTVELASEREASEVDVRCTVEPGPELDRTEDRFLVGASAFLGEGFLIHGRLAELEVMTQPRGYRLSTSPPPAPAGDAGPAASTPPPPPEDRPSDVTPPWLAALAREVKPGRFVVKREILHRLAEDSGVWTRSCRIVPAISGGEPSGFKLFAIREGSAPDLLGFENGDEIRRVGDVEVVDFERALEAWKRLRDASSVKVHLRRSREPRVHHYRIE